MAVVRVERSKGRNFTAEELLGRPIRIEGPAKRGSQPHGYAMMIIADDEEVANACKLELIIEPHAVVEAKVTLYRLDLATPEEQCPTEVAVLRDNVEVSFSAIVSEVE